MTLHAAQTAWETLQKLKLKHLETWELDRNSLNFNDLTSIPAMARALNQQMSNAMDVEEIHEAAHKLAQVVAALSLEDFTVWNRQEVNRQMDAGEVQSKISSEKLIAVINF